MSMGTIHRGNRKGYDATRQAHPAQTRQILRKVLPSRIWVWREVRESEKSYHFEGEAVVTPLTCGLLVRRSPEIL